MSNIFITHQNNRQHIEALRQCSNNAKFVELMQVKKIELMEQLVKMTDVCDIHRTQGKISAISNLLDAIEKSKELI